MHSPSYSGNIKKKIKKSLTHLVCFEQGRPRVPPRPFFPAAVIVDSGAVESLGAADVAVAVQWPRCGSEQRP